MTSLIILIIAFSLIQQAFGARISIDIMKDQIERLENNFELLSGRVDELATATDELINDLHQQVESVTMMVKSELRSIRLIMNSKERKESKFQLGVGRLDGAKNSKDGLLPGLINGKYGLHFEKENKASKDHQIDAALSEAKTSEVASFNEIGT